MSLSLAPGVFPVPGYSLTRLLGRGGFGEVWEAVAPGGVRVAMKFVRVNPREFGPEERALEIVSNIRHPHLLDIQFAARVDDYLVIAMPLCEKSLWDRLRECRDQGLAGLPLDELMGYMDEMASAVDYLNEPRHDSGDGRKVGVQHRDIKPHNIFLVGGSTRLADFGVAKILEGRAGEHTGNMSPHYVAPEVLEGRMCQQTDQYSLAMTYYHLRTGRLPFRGDSISQVIYAHLHQLADLSGLPEPEQNVITRALAKEPDDRWPNCRAFVRALQSAAPRDEAVTLSASSSSAHAGPVPITVAPSRLETSASEPRRALSTPPLLSDSLTQSLYEAQGTTQRADAELAPLPLPSRRWRNRLIGIGAGAALVGGIAFAVAPRFRPRPVAPPPAQVRTQPPGGVTPAAAPSDSPPVLADVRPSPSPALRSGDDQRPPSVSPPPTPPPPSDHESPKLAALAVARAPGPAGDLAAKAQDLVKPAARPHKGEHDLLVAIRDHLRSLPETDRAYLRFFTIQNLYNNTSVHDDDLKLARAAVAKLINSLSWKPAIVVPKPIDREQTVFALDLRDVGWDEPDRWNELLSRYPYGLKYDQAQDQATREAAREVSRLAQTSLPSVRADWFVANASRPPLYHALLKIPDPLQGLEKQLDVDPYGDFLRNKLARAGFATSGVSGRNRLVDRHPARFGAYWKSYDFKSSEGTGNLFRYPLGPVFEGNPFLRQAFEHAGGEVLFNLPNGLQGYLVVDPKGHRIDAGPIEVGGDPLKTAGTSALSSCMACHRLGIVPFKDTIRAGLAVAGEAGEKVESLYPEQAAMDRLIAEDQARYLKALEAATGSFLMQGENQKKPIRDFPEPVDAVTRAYLKDLGLEDLAAEFGLSDPKELLTMIRTNKRLRQLGLAPLLSDATIKRTAWDSLEGRAISAYQEAAHELGLGTPLLAY